MPICDAVVTLTCLEELDHEVAMLLQHTPMALDVPSIITKTACTSGVHGICQRCQRWSIGHAALLTLPCLSLETQADRLGAGTNHNFGYPITSAAVAVQQWN